MDAIRATAVRVCGAATLIVVVTALLEFAQQLTGVRLLPWLQLSTGAAVLVSIASFAVANAPRRSVAESICQCSIAVVAVLAALRVYELVATHASASIPDIALSLGSFALLGHLCRSVLLTSAASRTSGPAGP